ncbi:hypothetical protein DUI87_00639 [Hirundo rustica rustica]|uniref:Neurotransmitter-gated ion-channel ligand-binding domain-containing protein n=1 Tax=Hirundo rustica rustica TaxID=333673 RepID=A0A3M0LTJ2_HIRRU|nr:hypothetical protein DUI87_00639 [Hirundo rustica rustica]
MLHPGGGANIPTLIKSEIKSTRAAAFPLDSQRNTGPISTTTVPSEENFTLLQDHCFNRTTSVTPAELDWTATNTLTSKVSDTTACESEERLFHKLFSQYNQFIRPVENVSDPVTVYFELAITQLTNVDEVNQIMETNLWLRHDSNDTHNAQMGKNRLSWPAPQSPVDAEATRTAEEKPLQKKQEVSDSKLGKSKRSKLKDTKLHKEQWCSHCDKAAELSAAKRQLSHQSLEWMAEHMEYSPEVKDVISTSSSSQRT